MESAERERLRRRTEHALAKLRDTEWDETSDVAARTAARVVREMAAPDSEVSSIPWHRRRDVRIGGGIAATVLTLLASVLAALERLGLFD